MYRHLFEGYKWYSHQSCNKQPRNYISTSARFLLSTSSTIRSYDPTTCHLTYLHCTHGNHLFHAFTWTISTAAVLYKWSMWSAHRWNCRVAIRFSDWSEMSVFSLDLLREYFYIPTEINHRLGNTTCSNHFNQKPRVFVFLEKPTTPDENLSMFVFYFPRIPQNGDKHHLFTPQKTIESFSLVTAPVKVRNDEAS